MDFRALQKTIARGLYELGCEDEFAAIVARFRGWRGSIPNHRRRIWQSLSDGSPRAFDASLVLLAQRLFAYHGREDLCSELTGAVVRAQWEGQADRERGDGSNRDMRTVRTERRREVAS